MRLLVAAVFAACVLFPCSARADGTLTSVLFVSKSENKNQVHYGVHLDDTCAFTSSAPVFAYWRMLEKGPTVTEPLLPREQRGYGIAQQDIVNGGTVRLTLRALPKRPILIHVSRAPDGTCVARTEAVVAGVLVRLFNVHVALGFMRVDHLLLSGWAATGQIVRERLTT